jgi:hypothetical protein
MADEMRLPISRGYGSEDPDQHWFLCEAVWNIKNVTDEAVKRTQFGTTLRDCALRWYMNIVQGLAQPKPLNQIKNAIDCRVEETQVRVTMYYRAKQDQTEGGRTCMGVRSKIQDLNRSIVFSDPR